MTTLLNKKRKKDEIRDKRKTQYEEISKKYAKLDISELSLNEFINARQGEMNNFKQILDNKFSTKSGFQLLPKHMRRRAASHNPYRIPVRNRIYFKDMPNKSKCAKHKMKGRRRRLSLENRAERNNWLESHLYCSKRFKMIDYCGSKVPEKRNDKSLRACYKYFQHYSVASELSFFKLLVVKWFEGIESIVEGLGKEWSRVKIYSDKLVGPGIGLVQGDRVVILLDPAAVEETLRVLGKNTLKVLQMNLYECFGKMSENV